MSAKHRYQIGETVELEETVLHEFKGFKHIASSDVFRTICDWTKEYGNAFINGEGGTLYFGIEDDGVVTGVRLERKDRDDVQRRVGQIIKEFYPAVDPSLWRLELVPVHGSDDALVADLFVVELKISKGREDLYWPTSAGSAPYIRQAGGIIRMPPSMIEQRVRRGRIATAEAEHETTVEDNSVVAGATGKPTKRCVDSLGCEYIVVRRPSMTFTCRLPTVFGRGDDLTDAGGEIEIHTAEYRGVRVSLCSEDIRGSLMRGLRTPLLWHARPYLRQIDEELHDVTLGTATLRLRSREVRDLCQCIDHAVSIYREDLIQTEDILETWEYEIVQHSFIIGVSLLWVPLELWRLMHGFSQQFISSGNSEWHLFEPTMVSVQVGRGFSQHADLWPLSPQSINSWSVVQPDASVIVVQHLSDFHLPLPYASGDTSRREWTKSVGEAGIWTAERTKHWLLTNFIPKVLEYNGHRPAGEARPVLGEGIIDLRLHRLSPTGSDGREQLLDRVQVVQSWSYGSSSLVRRALVLPYYESLLTLAMQSKNVKLDYGYVGSNLQATMRSLTQQPAALHQPQQTLDDVVNQLRFHVERMRREPTEASRRLDLVSRVFLSFLEVKPNLSQRVLNELLRGVEPIWREARFEQRHMSP